MVLSFKEEIVLFFILILIVGMLRFDKLIFFRLIVVLFVWVSCVVIKLVVLVEIINCIDVLENMMLLNFCCFKFMFINVLSREWCFIEINFLV